MARSNSSQQATTWLTQLYFVLASLLGLLCLVIGIATLVNTLLMTYVVKVKAPRYSQPPQPYVEVAQLEKTTALSPDEKEALARWQQDYELWEKEQRDYDYEAENRRRSLAWSIALIITGAPVFALHAPRVFGHHKA